MICDDCRYAGDDSRWNFNQGYPPVSHPKDCGCPCMHKMPTQWEDMFSVKEPDEVHE